MPFMRTTLPEIPLSKPAAPEKTLYYQKDAAKPATVPQPVTMPVVPMPQPAMMPVNYQDPATIPPQQGVPSLPTGAINYDAPAIRDINLLSDAELKRTIIAEAEKQYRSPDNIY